MDVGSTNGWRLDDVVPAQEIVDRIGATWPLEPVDRVTPGDVATRWRYRDGGGEIGVIASVTQPFCGACTRARISAEGKLYTCLFAAAGHDLRELLRSGVDDADAGRAHPRHLGAPHRSLLRPAHRRDHRAAEGRDVAHRRLAPGGAGRPLSRVASVPGTKTDTGTAAMSIVPGTETDTGDRHPCPIGARHQNGHDEERAPEAPRRSQPCGSGAVPCWMPSSVSRSVEATGPNAPPLMLNSPEFDFTWPTAVMTAAVPQANTSLMRAVLVAAAPLVHRDPPLLDAVAEVAAELQDRVARDAGEDRARQLRRHEPDVVAARRTRTRGSCRPSPRRPSARPRRARRRRRSRPPGPGAARRGSRRSCRPPSRHPCRPVRRASSPRTPRR